MDVQQKSRFTVTRSSKAVSADQRAVLLVEPGFGRLAIARDRGGIAIRLAPVSRSNSIPPARFCTMRRRYSKG
jgi:hypothetical protein